MISTSSKFSLFYFEIFIPVLYNYNIGHKHFLIMGFLAAMVHFQLGIYGVNNGFKMRKTKKDAALT